MNRYQIMLETAVAVLLGVGFLALIAVPAEGIALSRWFALMLLSKCVGIFAMAMAIYFYKLLNKG